MRAGLIMAPSASRSRSKREAHLTGERRYARLSNSWGRVLRSLVSMPVLGYMSADGECTSLAHSPRISDLQQNVQWLQLCGYGICTALRSMYACISVCMYVCTYEHVRGCSISNQQSPLVDLWESWDQVTRQFSSVGWRPPYSQTPLCPAGSPLRRPVDQRYPFPFPMWSWDPLRAMQGPF
jgi:hypothetical protein